MYSPKQIMDKVIIYSYIIAVYDCKTTNSDESSYIRLINDSFCIHLSGINKKKNQKKNRQNIEVQ